MTAFTPPPQPAAEVRTISERPDLPVWRLILHQAPRPSVTLSSVNPDAVASRLLDQTRSLTAVLLSDTTGYYEITAELNRIGRTDAKQIQELFMTPAFERVRSEAAARYGKSAAASLRNFLIARVQRDPQHDDDIVFTVKMLDGFDAAQSAEQLRYAEAFARSRFGRIFHRTPDPNTVRQVLDGTSAEQREQIFAALDQAHLAHNTKADGRLARASFEEISSPPYNAAPTAPLALSIPDQSAYFEDTLGTIEAAEVAAEESAAKERVRTEQIELTKTKRLLVQTSEELQSAVVIKGGYLWELQSYPWVSRVSAPAEIQQLTAAIGELQTAAAALEGPNAQSGLGAEHSQQDLEDLRDRITDIESRLRRFGITLNQIGGVPTLKSNYSSAELPQQLDLQRFQQFSRIIDHELAVLGPARAARISETKRWELRHALEQARFTPKDLEDLDRHWALAHLGTLDSWSLASARGNNAAIEALYTDQYLAWEKLAESARSLK